MRTIYGFCLVVCIAVSVAGCDSWLNLEPDEGFCLGCSDAGTDGGADAGCTSNAMCTTASTSKCLSGDCVACVADADCSHIDGTNICDNSTCVQCTVETEAEHCGMNSCNPATKTCTATPTGMTGTCKPCVADSECITDHRCITLEFDGTDREVSHCMKLASSGCTRPYTVVLTDRGSLSNPQQKDTYCGVDQAVTTCEAVLDLSADVKCGSGVDEDQAPADPDKCGATGLSDALCEQVNFVDFRCTYACGIANECPGTLQCNTVDAGMPSERRYCGAPP